jgi:hypothetical protein
MPVRHSNADALWSALHCLMMSYRSACRWHTDTSGVQRTQSASLLDVKLQHTSITQRQQLLLTHTVGSEPTTHLFMLPSVRTSVNTVLPLCSVAALLDAALPAAAAAAAAAGLGVEPCMAAALPSADTAAAAAAVSVLPAALPASTTSIL